MKRLRPLSRTLALLAATHMSLAPVFVSVAHATTPPLDDDIVTVTTPTTVIDTTDIAEIIAALSSTDIAEVQARYNELLDYIEAREDLLETVTDAAEVKTLTAEITNLKNLAKAFKAILEGYEDSGAKTVVSTTTTIDPETGDRITRTTYSDGSYTETVEEADDDDYGDDGYGNSDSGSGGGGGSDFLQKMLENPAVQGMITGLLQKLLSGGLGNLGDMVSGLFGTNNAASGDTLLGKVCPGGKCEGSQYNSPSPASQTQSQPATPEQTINSSVPFNPLGGVPTELQQPSTNNFGGGGTPQ